MLSAGLLLSCGAGHVSEASAAPTVTAQQVLKTRYGNAASRTLMMGGSNGGHHTKWMLERYPDLYDGGIAGYGFNSQVSQWGSIATLLRYDDVIALRIDDVIAKRSADPERDPRGRRSRRR